MNTNDIQSSYGINGLEVSNNIHTMTNLQVTFDPAIKRFTLVGSSSIDKNKMKAIFEQAQNFSWKPVLCEKGSLEDYTFKFVDPSNDVKEIKIPLPGESARHYEARKIVANIQESLSYNLSGKQVIDIGCRSCENACAMGGAGASVVGIDPDTTEFDPEGKIELYPVTLQEFAAAFPDRKFDLATVFLWNINEREEDEFVQSLVKVINPQGSAIVGWSDAPYDSTISSLMHSAFKKVEFYKFPSDLNWKMVKCSFPK